LPHSHETDDSISRFLQLPIVPVSRSRRGTGEGPLIDYSKSILMTSDSYIDSLEVLPARRQDATRARETRKLEAEARKQRREVEKAECEKRKKHREEERAAKAGETAYWKDVAARGWGNQLQAVMKSGVAPPPGSYTGVYLGDLPAWCIQNQRRRKFLQAQKKARTLQQQEREPANH
jgi:hypothetical protein